MIRMKGASFSGRTRRARSAVNALFAFALFYPLRCLADPKPGFNHGVEADAKAELRLEEESAGSGPSPQLSRAPPKKSPSIEDDLLLVSALDGKLYALDAASGAPRWQFSSGAPLVAVSNTASLSSDAGGEWDTEMKAQERAFEAQGKEYVFPGADGALYAFHPRKNLVQMLHSSVKEYQRLTPSLTPDGGVVLGSSHSTVFLVDPHTGELLQTLSNANAAATAADLADMATEKDAGPQNASDVLEAEPDKDAGEGVPPLANGARGSHSAVAPRRSPLFVVRRDYTLRKLDEVLGTEVWNVSYSELLTMNPTETSGASAQKASMDLGVGSAAGEPAKVVRGVPTLSASSAARGQGQPAAHHVPGGGVELAMAEENILAGRGTGSKKSKQPAWQVRFPTTPTAVYSTRGQLLKNLIPELPEDGEQEAITVTSCGDQFVILRLPNSPALEPDDDNESGGNPLAVRDLSPPEVEEGGGGAVVVHDLTSGAGTPILPSLDTEKLGHPRVLPSQGTCRVQGGGEGREKGQGVGGGVLAVRDGRHLAKGVISSVSWRIPVAPRGGALVAVDRGNPLGPRQGRGLLAIGTAKAPPPEPLPEPPQGHWHTLLSPVTGPAVFFVVAMLCWIVGSVLGRLRRHLSRSGGSPVKVKERSPVSQGQTWDGSSSQNGLTLKEKKKKKKGGGGSGLKGMGGSAEGLPLLEAAGQEGEGRGVVGELAVARPRPRKGDRGRDGSTGLSEEHVFGIPPEGLWVGNIWVSPEVLGRGSNGTTVFLGQYMGRRVAVKRVLQEHTGKVDKEIDMLVISDQHECIVRCFSVEQKFTFSWLALEFCHCNLYELVASSSTGVALPREGRIVDLKVDGDPVALWDSRGLPTPALLQIMRDVVSGVMHLHGLGIVHRDLKPQNVLVSAPNGGGVRAKLSDMGISKRLESIEASFNNTTGGALAGSTGYKAPEQLQHPPRPQTAAVDAFALGCLLFFCATGGRHPFGEEAVHRDSRIASRRGPDLLSLHDFPEAVDLVSRLLAFEPSERISALDALHHPMLWSSHKRLAFLVEVSDRVEGKENGTEELIAALEEHRHEAMGADWRNAFSKDLWEELVSHRTYDTKTVRDLLRIIRNKYHHYRELPESVQEVLGSIPDGYESFFRIKFPNLLIEVYKVIMVRCRMETAFKKYFPPS